MNANVTPEAIETQRQHFAGNLNDWYDLSQDYGLTDYGLNWYVAAGELMKWSGKTYLRHPLALQSYLLSSGVTTVLSPGVNWIKNIIDAEAMLRAAAPEDLAVEVKTRQLLVFLAYAVQAPVEEDRRLLSRAEDGRAELQ